jgi:hypothetical protein
MKVSSKFYLKLKFRKLGRYTAGAPSPAGALASYLPCLQSNDN